MKTIAIIGGTGFIGTELTHQLSSDPSLTLRRIGRNADLEHSFEGCDTVINLVGILHGTPTEFERIHVDLPRAIIAAAQKKHVKRLLHMSALGAGEAAPSFYQKTKARGEQLVQSSELAWTIFRPSVVFGQKDHFLNLFAHLLRFFPVFPLAGAHTRFQPVWVNDVAHAFVCALEKTETIGHILELVGPQTYTLKELVEYVGKKTGHARPVIPLPFFIGYLQAFLLSYLPGSTLMSVDNVRSLTQDNISQKGFPIELLNFKPTALEEVF